MSYILDALRRADAERERDPSRGIHAQPAAAALPQDERPPREPWILAGVAVLVAIGGAYLLAGPQRERAQAPAQVTPVVVVQPAPAAPPPVAAVMPVATAVLPPPPPTPAPAMQRPVPRPILASSDQGVVRAPVVTARLDPAPPAAPGVTSQDAGSPPGAAPVPRPSAAPAPAWPAAPSAAPSTAPATAPSTAPTTGPSVAPSGAAPARGGPAPDRIVAVSELPADVQRELPKLVIAGGVHSENAAQRMLIVGGQVRSEGAELAPGLVLEQIRANSAVLRFRGWRYSVSF